MREKNQKIIIKYGELWLKSEPVKKRFIDALAENVRSSLRSNGVRDFRLGRKRDMLVLETDEAKAEAALSSVFGISWFTRAMETLSEMRQIENAALEEAGKIKKSETFAVRAGRSDKSFQFTSNEIENRIGAKIDRSVDLSNPDFTIYVEVGKDRSYVYSRKIKGAGGLPYGVSGRTLSLISGGIDSPVASWFMMKRGCSVDFVHFYADRKDVRKIEALLEKLRRYAPLHLNLYSVHFAPIQQAIVRDCERRYTCVLCKRLMYRISSTIAAEIKAKALVTGENLAQVASQTLDNLAANSDVIRIPILRPLLGMDKEETIAIAKRIGTYDVSIKSAEACKFVPSKPATKADSVTIAKEEAKIKNLNSLIKEAVLKCERLVV